MDMKLFSNDADTVACLDTLHYLCLAVGGINVTGSPQVDACSVMISLLVELPNNKVWQANATTCVPLLRALAQQVRTTADLLDKFVKQPNEAQVLQARLFHYAIDTLVQCASTMLPTESHVNTPSAHARFTIALYTEMAVLHHE